MALIKKSIQQQTTYSLSIPVDLQQRIDHIAQVAERRDMTFDLNSTLQRAIKNEVTRAETALGIGARARRTKAQPAVQEEISTGSEHTTPAGGNVFVDLGFEPEEAAALKAQSQQVIQPMP